MSGNWINAVAKVPAIDLLVFVSFFVGLWLAVVFLIRLGSGWDQLIKRYRQSSLPDDLPWQRIPEAGLGPSKWRFSLANYRNVISVAPTQAGLYVKTMALFSLSHPPLMIPWSDMTVEHRIRSLIGFKHHQISFEVKPCALRLRCQVGLNAPILTQLAPYLSEPEA